MKHEININDQDKIIQFKKVIKKPACEHLKIQISEDDQEILCLDCNTKVNPIWWIVKNLERTNSAVNRNKALVSEYRAIWEKLQAKRKYCCKHCSEVNTIDFHKLISAKAIERGLKLVDEDFDGYGVERS